jgi:hypothetical protein
MYYIQKLYVLGRLEAEIRYAVNQLIVIKLFLPPNCLQFADSGESSDE